MEADSLPVNPLAGPGASVLSPLSLRTERPAYMRPPERAKVSIMLAFLSILDPAGVQLTLPPHPDRLP